MSETDSQYILENLELFAALFAQNPTALATLLLTLNIDEEDHNYIQKVGYEIKAALKDSDRLAVSAALINSEKSSDRIIGLDLIGENLEGSSEFSRQFYNVMTSERDVKVLQSALNHIRALTEDSQNIDVIMPALDHLIQNSDSDYIAGTALVQKSNLVTPYGAIRNDVMQAMTHASSEAKSYGLAALDILIRKETAEFRAGIFENDNPSWVQIPGLSSALNDMADDSNLDERYRQKALKLIRDIGE